MITPQERRLAARRYKQRRVLLIVLVPSLLVVSWLVLLGPGSHSRTPHPSGPVIRKTSSTTPTTRGTSPTTTSIPTSPADRTYAIGDMSEVYSEPGKDLVPPHSPGGDVAVVRQVSAEILYPAAGTPGSGPVTGAPPARGPFPLVVFGPGYDESTNQYAPVLNAWVSHGFVVAAITFPLTNPNAPGGPYRPDILNQPGDMATVAEQVIAASANESGPLHGVVNPSEVALAGQSDGGDTALALAYNTCCRVIPVAATIILSGAELHSYGGFPGTFFPTGTQLPPLLAFQGTDDPVFNPPAYTNQYFAAALQPKYLVCLNGADHLEAYTTTDTYEAVVAQASVDFLDAYLWHRPGALAAMTAAVTTSSVAGLASSCPLS